MTSEHDDPAPHTHAQLRARLHVVARELNDAIDKGKLREIRKVVDRSHEIVWQAIKELESSPTPNQPLFDDAMALFMDIRWGQRTTKFL
ncbi:MAG: hypothetical protein EPN57_18360 [Paraburkholderia sp.]|nr:MAG: hypothetical protein EPN57_18360 [Paraburkholderia sp.]